MKNNTRIPAAVIAGLLIVIAVLAYMLIRSATNRCASDCPA